MKRKYISCIAVILALTMAGFSPMIWISSEENGGPYVVGMKEVVQEPQPDLLPTAELSYLIKYSDGSLVTPLYSIFFELLKAQKVIKNAKVYYEGETRVVSFDHRSNSTNNRTFEAVMYPYLQQRLEVEGASLEIPSDALTRPVRIMVRPLNSTELERLDPSMWNVTDQHHGYRFGPHGFRFDAPVTMRLPYDPSMSREIAESDIQTYYFDENVERWIPIEKVGVDPEEHVIISRTQHFTDFINSTLILPDHPSPTSFDPNTLKNVMLADPSEGITLIEPPKGDATGWANISYPLDLPPGRNGRQPELTVTYRNQLGNGWLGLGWSLTLPNIQVDTRFGVPRYDNADETETYLLNGAQLAPVANLLAPESRTTDKAFTLRVEGSFQRIIRHGNSPNNYWWELTDKSGTRNIFGKTAQARLSDYAGNGDIIQWNIEQTIDVDGNTVDYTYFHDSPTTTLQTLPYADILMPSSEPWTQIYPKQIDYTGVNGSGAFYHVKFFLDDSRQDIFSSGRPGFKTYTRLRLDHIDVLAGSETVRRYQFLYKTGDFGKSLLEHIVVFGENGANEFHRHSFEYFEMPKQGSDIDGFGPETAWGGTLNSKRGLTRQEGYSGGANAWLGVGPGDCSWNIGAGVGFSLGKDTTRTLFLDVNGDGLPDRLRDSGSAEINSLDANHTLGQYQNGSFSGVSKRDLGYSENYAFNFQAGLHLLSLQSSLNAHYTWSHVNEDHIVSDVNGDGFPDFVSVDNGDFEVKLNDGKGSFQAATSWSGYSLDHLDFTDSTEETEVKGDFHKSDSLLKWVAPFAGTVNLTGTIQRKAAGGDGVMATILKGNTRLWQRTFNPTDLSPCVPGPSNSCGSGLLGISVSAGDRFYFKLNALDDTDFDTMLWDPEITYTGTSTLLQEQYGPSIYYFSQNADFRLAGIPILDWTAHAKGTVDVSGAVVKQTGADDIIVRVVKNGSTTLWSQNLSAGTTGNFPHSFSENVLATDTLSFEVQSDSPIDPARITWAPVVTYTYIYRDDPATGNPVGGAVTCSTDPVTGELACTMQNDPIPEAPHDPDVIIQNAQVRYPVFQYLPNTPTATYVAPATGLIRIYGTVQKTPGAPAVRVYVQGVHRLHYKQSLAASASGNFSHDFNINVTAGDQLFFSVVSTTSLAPTNVTWAPTIAYLSPSLPSSSPTVNFRRVDPAMASEPMSGGYHRWFFGEWNGDETFDESQISASNPTNTYFSPSVPRQQGLEGVPVPLWISQRSKAYIAAGEMKPARQGTNVGQIISGTGISALRKAIGKNWGVGANFIAFSASVSEGETVGQLDFFDINGDRFPDQVAQGEVRFNNGFNGFGSAETIPSFGFGDLRRTENRNVSFTVGQGWLIDKITGEGITSTLAHLLPSLGVYGGISSTQVDFVDMNGDGLLDHVKRDPGGALKVRLNLGYKFGQEETWMDSSWVHSDILDDLGLDDLNVFGSDTDTNVLSFSNKAGAKVGLNLGIFGAGASYDVTRNVVDYIDINGDGLPDHVMKRDGEGFFRVKQNLGDHFGPEHSWLVPAWNVGLGIPIPGTSKSTDSIFGGNDTLSFAESLTGNVSIMIPIFIPVPPTSPVICIAIEISAFLSGHRMGTEMMLEDLDGDGTPDQILKKDGDLDTNSSVNTKVYAKLNKRGKTNLLKTITRPLGGRILLDYHREGNTVDYSISTQEVDMPFNQWVLSSVTTEDGRGNSYTNTYDYFTSGFYDRQERENYGYYKLQQTRPDGSTIDRYYHNQDFYLKGLMYKQVVADASGNLFEVNTKEYDLRDVQSGSKFPALVAESTFYYEGTTSNEAGYQKSTRMEFDYDSFGNVTVFDDFGDEGSADETFGSIGYYKDLTSYIMKPDILQVLDSSSNILRKRIGTFDAKGHMTKLESILIGGKDPATGALYTGTTNPIQQLSYDSYGNIKSFVDPSGYTLNYKYDSTVNTYITEISDSFGYVSKAKMDLKYGLLKETTDTNGNQVKRSYDEFGRLVKVYGPYDIGLSPTITMEYHPDASPPYAISHHKDITATSDPITTVRFIDGLQREIQIKKDNELDLGTGTSTQVGMTVSGKIVFDTLGRIAKQGQLVFDTGMAQNFVTVMLKNPIQFEYDVLDRTTKVTNPDSSTITTNYGFGTLDGVTRFKATQTDPEGKSKKRYRSVREEIIGIEEFNTIAGVLKTLTTRYSYDPLSKLVRIKDANGNVTKIGYDTLGRRIVFDNPDTGSIEFRYDLADNLGAKITANLAIANKEIKYLYTYKRLDRIDYPMSVDVVYTYGKPSASFNRAGRIVTVQDESGLEERFYGKLGETVKTTKTFTSKTPTKKGETYTTEYVFDSFGRLHNLTYPDGEILTYSYNAGGLLESVKGALRGLTYLYLQHKGYDEFEGQMRVIYGNGVETKYKYDAKRRWLDNLKTDKSPGKPIQNVDYTYDLIGNVLGIENDIPVTPPKEMGGPTEQEFEYDDLYQLTDAEGVYEFEPGKENRYQLELVYDEIGNLVRKVQENSVVQSSGKVITQKDTTSPRGHGHRRPYILLRRERQQPGLGSQPQWDPSPHRLGRR